MLTHLRLLSCAALVGAFSGPPSLAGLRHAQSRVQQPAPLMTLSIDLKGKTAFVAGVAPCHGVYGEVGDGGHGLVCRLRFFDYEDLAASTPTARSPW